MSKMNRLLKICDCVTESKVLLIDTELPSENEDLEIIDEDELIEDTPISHKTIWEQIDAEFNVQRSEIEGYRALKRSSCDVPCNPSVQFLEDHIFPFLKGILVDTLNKAKELDCVKHQKSTFNGLDFIAEQLWNINPRYLERNDTRTYIFDMPWVVQWLGDNPRPYFPLSWVWSRAYGATKIQAYMRGHWARSRRDVQEMRQFWKTIREENKELDEQ